MAPQVGLEPTTDRLTADCSTTELLWNINNFHLPLSCSGILGVAWQRPTLAGEKPQLPSALESLTTVFGMGTGVTSPPSPPDKFLNLSDNKYYICFSQKFKRYFEITPSKLDKNRNQYDNGIAQSSFGSLDSRLRIII
jgi:hypothetical protein